MCKRFLCVAVLTSCCEIFAGTNVVSVVHDAVRYNAWPMVQSIGERLVCAYSRGSAHSIGEGARGVWAKVSDDGGVSWSDERLVVNDPRWGEVTTGKGLDANGAMLLWIRCWSGAEKHHDLYRTVDGVVFEKIATPKLDPVPMQITDIFNVPGRGLMSLWFSAGYDYLAGADGKAWGTLVSPDGGKTWERFTAESNLKLEDWPTEPSGVYLGDGRILVVARSEAETRHQFQIVSEDNGRTWRKYRTNITDVCESTPSSVLDATGGLIFNYYYQRGAKELKCRIARVEDVLKNPCAWPDPTVLFKGHEERAFDAGNVNVTRLGDTHYAATYTGTPTDAAVVVVAIGSRGLAQDASKVRYIDEFDLSRATCGLGKVTLSRQSVDGHPLTVGGKVYGRGFGSHSEGAVGFRTDGRVEAFDACVAVDDDAAEARRCDRQPQVVFKVWADGKIVWTSPVMRLGMRPVDVHVDLKGVREIVLETSSAAPWLAFEACNGDWLDARFTCADGGKIEPIVDSGATAQLGILTPPEKPEPQINGADIWGVRPGHPVIFRVATSGVRPMRFTAKGLPTGVTLDPAKGILGGVAPQEKGDYDIEVTAENAHGCAVRTIRLAVGDTLALTPPMGWNSWNIWGENFSGEHAMAAARALDESGLGDHGWAYVNLDDFWEMNNSPQNKDRPELRGPARDAEGKILSNPSFPDMKGLTDYIHSFGFKAGLYSSPGPTTCGGCEGSYGHELQDATRWAEWGFDYVKYDWCSYDEILKDELGANHWYDGTWRDQRGDSKQKPYRLMKDCLRKQSRDILYSFCQYGMGHVEEWTRDAGANCWRCWEDMKDTWPWMEKALESRIGAENYWKFAGPGCWVDPDMMIVGDQRSFGTTHPTYLTRNEQYTHVSLWCMIGSPLLIGCDLTKLDPFTKSLLVNDEVIAVSQDRLGRIAKRIRQTDAESVWVRPLVGGDIAVALVNRYPFAREIKVSFSDLGISGERWVKDLWRQKCEGRHSGDYFALVPPHATKLIKMRPVKCSKCD